MCGCALPYLACSIAVVVTAVASGMWHAAGRAVRVTTDGQVTSTSICIWLPSRAPWIRVIWNKSEIGNLTTLSFCPNSLVMVGMRLRLRAIPVLILSAVGLVAGEYMDGTSLGGWMVMEAWLYPNILLVQGVSPAVSPAVKGNQELDYINRMRSVDIDAIASMRALWNTYVVDDLLGSDNPDISRLVALKQAGVKYIRIPVGWWIMEAPTDVPPQYAREGGNYTMRDPGYTVDGFVSGGIVFVEKLLGLLKKLGMRAYSESG